MRATARGWWAVVLAVGAMGGAAWGEGLRAGSAMVCITPPAGTPMAGYYSERGAETVHDDLFARALVVERDGVKAAMVSLDLITTTRPLVAAARKEIAVAPGIPPEAVLIAATHTHTGPVITDRGHFDEVVGGTRPEAKSYNDTLPGKIAEAVRRANAALAPADAFVAAGRESSIPFNRRFHMRDGTVGWNPGKLHPNIVRPAGPVDPEVLSVWFGKEASPIAACVNFAVHLDNVGGAAVSADLPFTLSRLLVDVRGTNLVTLFQNGCCGDINHIDVTWAAPQKGHENAARMGTILAAEVLRNWRFARAATNGALRFRHETLALPLAPVDDAMLARARAVQERVRSKVQPAPKFMEQVEAYKALDVEARHGKPIEAEVQTIVLGPDLAWVGVPGEVFCELGLAIKKGSPYRHTLVTELANGAVGYIPARHAYAEGNYEVVSARCAEGAGEMIVDAAVRMLRQLREGL